MKGVLILGIALLAASALMFGGPAQASAATDYASMTTQVQDAVMAVDEMPVSILPAVAQVVHDPGSCVAAPAAVEQYSCCFRPLRAIGKGIHRLLCFRARC